MASIKGTKGVDISTWQGNIDLSKVKNAGYQWVMIRTGQGTRITDNQFANNVAKAEKLGMPWGIYHFAEATTAKEAEAEVAYVDKLLKAQLAKGYKPTLPIAYDIEEGGFSSNKYTPSVLTTIASTWVTNIKKLGYYPMIYSGYYEFRDYISKSVLNKCDVWLAEWGRYPDYTEDNLGIWQYGGETNLIESNSITGVGVIDKDKAYKDYPTIIKQGGYNGWKKSTITTTTKTNKTTTTTKTVNSKHTVKNILNTANSLLNHDEHSGACDIMYWYGGFSTSINSVACCCAGQMYLFYKAGAFDLIPGGKVADCGSLCKNFYNAGQLYGPSQVKPGDLVIFSWSKERSSYWPASSLGYNTLDHVELCVAVNNDGTITCIGANNGGYECDDFQKKTRYKSNISCCCRPKYETGTTTTNTTTNTSTSGSSSSTNTGSSTIKTVQKWLNTNYKTGLTVDGAYGPKTKAALVKALQTELNKQYKAGLVVDGVYGTLTNNRVVTLQYGCQGNITRILQGLLICNGYSTNGFDGLYGQGTVKAVKSYQSKKGLSVDGIAGRATFSSLCK